MKNYSGKIGPIYFVLIPMVISLSACQVGRFFIYNFADIRDHRKFPSRDLVHDGVPFLFQEDQNFDTKKTSAAMGLGISFEEYLENNETVAFLIIHKDTIVYENYFQGYEESSIVPSFSMAKSVTSMLIGCALDDGLIQSVDDPVVQYIPDLASNGFEKLTIRHLLQMTSGIEFNESYFNPFGDAAAFYYGRNLRRKIGKLKLSREPGEKFEYASGNTELLGFVLEDALKEKTVTQYFQEKIWTPLGMEYDASWSVDKKNNGIEKTFCCINARTRDFARLGRLYLNKGNWNGKQLISREWVKESTIADVANGGTRFYQYQWWIPNGNGDFMALGFLGQFIYVNPSKEVIIVRLGKKKGDVDWWRFFPALAANY